MTLRRRSPGLLPLISEKSKNDDDRRAEDGREDEPDESEVLEDAPFAVGVSGNGKWRLISCMLPLLKVRKVGS